MFYSKSFKKEYLTLLAKTNIGYLQISIFRLFLDVCIVQCTYINFDYYKVRQYRFNMPRAYWNNNSTLQDFKFWIKISSGVSNPKPSQNLWEILDLFC